MKRAALVLMAAAMCSGASGLFASQQEKIVINQFAVPVAVPVSPYSPYYYSSSQVQQKQYAAPPRSAEDILAERIAKKVAAYMRSPEGTASASALPTLFSQKCALCHAEGDAEKGKPQLTTLEALSDQQRLKAIAAVMSGAMPKGGKLTADEAAQIVKELSSPIPRAQAMPSEPKP